MFSFSIFFLGVKVTLEESDNEGDQDDKDDGKPSVSQSHSHPSGM